MHSDDPTLRVKKFAKGEFHTWTEDEIAQYERRWPMGSTPRLAFALLLYTGQRRSDVVAMSWTDVQDGTISVVPLKTKRSTGVKLWIPVHPALAEVLEHADRTAGTILVTNYGQAFAATGFGNYMADKIDDAELPARCVTHGLRKAAARRLAEAGCTTNEIAAITGHATLQEVARYTKAAEQHQLAKTAMKRLENKPPVTGVQTSIARPNSRVDSQTSIEGLGKIRKTPINSMGENADWWSRGEETLGSTFSLISLVLLSILARTWEHFLGAHCPVSHPKPRTAWSQMVVLSHRAAIAAWRGWKAHAASES